MQYLQKQRHIVSIHVPMLYDIQTHLHCKIPTQSLGAENRDYDVNIGCKSEIHAHNSNVVSNRLPGHWCVLSDGPGLEGLLKAVSGG